MGIDTVIAFNNEIVDNLQANEDLNKDFAKRKKNLEAVIADIRANNDIYGWIEDPVLQEQYIQREAESVVTEAYRFKDIVIYSREILRLQAELSSLKVLVELQEKGFAAAQAKSAVLQATVADQDERLKNFELLDMDTSHQSLESLIHGLNRFIVAIKKSVTDNHQSKFSM